MLVHCQRIYYTRWFVVVSMGEEFFITKYLVLVCYPFFSCDLRLCSLKICASKSSKYAIKSGSSTMRKYDALVVICFI